MEQYLIDNNVISGYFSGNFSQKAMDFLAEVIDRTPKISVITEIEALSWVHPNKEKEAIVRAFISDSELLPLSPEVVASCVQIRRSKKLKTPDAIIAATALVHGLTLLTSDKDFDVVEKLKRLDPKQL